MTTTPERPSRCPICGRGTLADIAFDAEAPSETSGSETPEQQPESRQLDTYTCGHQVLGAQLAAADERLDVERRASDETAEPLPEAE
jgi:hypothetical protein